MEEGTYSIKIPMRTLESVKSHLNIQNLLNEYSPEEIESFRSLDDNEIDFKIHSKRYSYDTISRIKLSLIKSKRDAAQKLVKAGALTGGKIIDIIQEKKIYLEFKIRIKRYRNEEFTDLNSNFKLLSWRGSYDLPSIELSHEIIDGETLVKNLLESTQEFQTGYKGGEFRMKMSDPLMVSNYGNSDGGCLVGHNIHLDDGIIDFILIENFYDNVE